MYVICYFDRKLKLNIWELISGEDAMQNRVSELCDDEGLEPDDIMVFNADDEIE